MKEKINNFSQKFFQGVNLGKFFLGLILILIGISYLGEKFGLITVNIGFLASHFWALFLIWIGLSFIGKKNKQVQYIGLMVAIVVLVFVAVMMFSNPMQERMAEVENFEIPKLENVSSALVDINSGAVVLAINGKNTSEFISGKFESEFLKLISSYKILEDQDNKEKVELSAVGGINFGKWNYFGKNINNLEINLNPEIIFDLNINSAASVMKIDLSFVKADNVKINSGASNIELTLGNLIEKSSVNIKTGASAVVLNVPQNIGVKVILDSNLASINLKGFSKKSVNVYESDNYQSANKFTEIVLETGVSRIDFNWLSV